MSPQVIKVIGLFDSKRYWDAKGESNLNDGIEIDGLLAAIRREISKLTAAESQFLSKHENIAPYLEQVVV